MRDIDALTHDLMNGKDGVIRGEAVQDLAKVGGPAVDIRKRVTCPHTLYHFES